MGLLTTSYWDRADWSGHHWQRFGTETRAAFCHRMSPWSWRVICDQECAVLHRLLEWRQARQTTNHFARIIPAMLLERLKETLRIPTVSRPELKGSWLILSVSKSFAVFWSLGFGKKGFALALERNCEETLRT